VVVVSPGGEEAVWVKSRNWRAMLCTFTVACSAATTYSQGTAASSHFEAYSDRIVPETRLHSCTERASHLGFFGANDAPFSLADAGFIKPDFGQFPIPPGGCESELTSLPAMKVRQSLPQRRDACLPVLTAAPGVSRDAAGCAQPIKAAEAEEYVAEELPSLGKAGERIAQARAEVLGILSSENACSAWFATKEADPAGIFRTLSYSIDWRGPQDISESEPEPTIFVWRQPYVARTTQDSGPYTAITINRNGAFFQVLGMVDKISLEGGPARTGQPRLLLVGPYRGNTREAQIVTLLHEFGHIIDLLPTDADDLGGKSVRNTDEVLQHCKTEIETRLKDLRETAKK
jgi:hypothetical protein